MSELSTQGATRSRLGAVHALVRSSHLYVSRFDWQVIAGLIELAEEMRESQNRGERLGLSEDEVAFYDALEVNDSALKVLGDETLQRTFPIYRLRSRNLNETLPTIQTERPR